MTWMVGRELSQVKKSNKTTSFKYNADGLRTEKISDDTTRYYYDSNGNMIALCRNDAAVMYFYYDSEGNATSLSFDGTKYFFIKNIQGDVEKIVTHQGNVVVSYEYDAWGNLLGKTDSTNFQLSKLNPFRYRSYIYDDETGLYYLRSRYYDPQTGRFLNADAHIDTQTGSSLSTNMFAYCENNPKTFLKIIHKIKNPAGVNLQDFSFKSPMATNLLPKVTMFTKKYLKISSFSTKNSLKFLLLP